MLAQILHAEISLSDALNISPEVEKKLSIGKLRNPRWRSRWRPPEQMTYIKYTLLSNIDQITFQDFLCQYVILRYPQSKSRGRQKILDRKIEKNARWLPKLKLLESMTYGTNGLLLNLEQTAYQDFLCQYVSFRCPQYNSTSTEKYLNGKVEKYKMAAKIRITWIDDFRWLLVHYSLLLNLEQTAL